LTGFGLFGLPSLALKLLGDGPDIPSFGNRDVGTWLKWWSWSNKHISSYWFDLAWRL